jgi:3-oxoadipate enol-lactonase
MDGQVKVPVPQCSLAARVDGPTDKPWLVLSNSLGADNSMWDAQMPALTARYRVLRYDVRGHGASELSTSPIRMDTLVADVVALMNYFDIGRTAFLGLSLGGMTGLGVALDHPQRLTHLICCAARADAPPDYVRTWCERITAIKTGGIDAVAPGILDRWLSPATRTSRPDVEAAISAMIRRTPAAGYIGCAEALKSLDYLGRLASMTVPTLYVAGEGDVSAPPSAMRRMADRTPGAQMRVVTGAAHLINCDNPTGFARAIGDHRSD